MEIKRRILNYQEVKLKYVPKLLVGTYGRSQRVFSYFQSTSLIPGMSLIPLRCQLFSVASNANLKFHHDALRFLILCSSPKGLSLPLCIHLNLLPLTYHLESISQRLFLGLALDFSYFKLILENITFRDTLFLESPEQSPPG